jgi:hypothetical protein
MQKFKVQANGQYVGKYGKVYFVASDRAWRQYNYRRRNRNSMCKYQVYYIDYNDRSHWISGAHTLSQANAIIEEYGPKIQKNLDNGLNGLGEEIFGSVFSFVMIAMMFMGIIVWLTNI